MRCETFVAKPLDDNVYLVIDEGTREAIVIDPALGGEAVYAKARDLEVSVKFILNTHGHADHTADNAFLQSKTGAKIGIHESDLDWLEKNAKNRPGYLAETPLPSKADLRLREGSQVQVGDTALTVLHTPGHTDGSACFYEGNRGVLFSGDTLLRGGPGRTDLLGSSPGLMTLSLRRLRQLPRETKVFPGHGPATRLADEAWMQNLSYPVL